MADEKHSRLGPYVSTTPAGERGKAFFPQPLPPAPPVDLSGLYQQLDRANQALGRLDGLTTLLPDAQLFLYLYARKEALLSSQIEGTKSSFSDLLLFENEAVPGVPSKMVKKSPIMSLQCSMVFVASKGVFRSRCASFGRFTEFCCEEDAGRTKHQANFAAHRIGLAVAVRGMLRLFPLRR